MKKYRQAEVAEKQLEDLVRRAPELIEKGLRFIDHQRRTDRGPLDVLLADAEGVLAVAELKVIEDDGMLMQGVDYCDYVTRNVEAIARANPSFGIDSDGDVRLILVAPNFSTTLLNRCKWINIPLSLFTYKCISFEDSVDVTPVYSEVTIPTLPELTQPTTIEDHTSYIADPMARRRLEALLARVRSWDGEGITIEPKQQYLSAKMNGSVFAYFKARRKSFVVATYDAKGDWLDFPISKEQELKAVEPLIKASADEFSKGSR